jgi:hypothetical protein
LDNPLRIIEIRFLRFFVIVFEIILLFEQQDLLEIPRVTTTIAKEGIFVLQRPTDLTNPRIESCGWLSALLQGSASVGDSTIVVVI